MTLKIYAFFHLNLLFSSIEESERDLVIKKCYWPLLEIAAKYNIPIGIEASAYTLEIISKIDQTWISRLKELIKQEVCEFIGCGYTQIIGPLVPAEVNRQNLLIGNQIYREILDIEPKLALVNEQAYSSGLVPIYLEAGYQGIIMEWNNPYQGNSTWDINWSYYPQNASGANNTSIKLLWNNCIAFQKFQRYVHGDLELSEIMDYIYQQDNNLGRSFPVYGSDAEIFDFRPGRFSTENTITMNEWQRIDELMKILENSQHCKWVSPTEAIMLKKCKFSGNNLKLESSSQPIPVKKQNKYNISRWGLTGRADFKINSKCYKLFNTVKGSNNNSEDWKELCYLWSSDFRTHITTKRWEKYLQRLRLFEDKLGINDHGDILKFEINNSKSLSNNVSNTIVRREGRFLIFEAKELKIIFNCRKGLAIEKFTNKNISQKPLFGTIAHGYYENIAWGADYYSGHMIYSSPGKHQITDLEPVDPIIEKEGMVIRIKCRIETYLGQINKKWIIDMEKENLTLSYDLAFDEESIGCLRISPVTLFQDSFDHQTLEIKTHNGGDFEETFKLHNIKIDCGKAVSNLVSSNQGLGLTKGKIDIGDLNKTISISFDQSESAFLGQISHQLIGNKSFARISLSSSEVDDTSKPKKIELKAKIKYQFNTMN